MQLLLRQSSKPWAVQGQATTVNAGNLEDPGPAVQKNLVITNGFNGYTIFLKQRNYFLNA